MALYPSISNFVLEEDIDLKDIEWSPVNFTGTLNGQNHKIENLKFKSQKSLSLFGRNSGNIANLQIVLSDNEYKEITSFAGVATANYGTISNCVVNGTLTIQTNLDAVIGGLVGKNYADIENCQTSLTITIDAGYNDVVVGGLVGISTEGKILPVVKKNASNITLNAIMTDCKKFVCGGLIGKVYNHQTSSQNESHVDIAIAGSSQNTNVGGLFGEEYFASADNYSTGEIDLTDVSSTACVGGITGQFKNSNREITILHSYSTIEIIGGSNIVKGGLVGEMEGYIDSCFSNQTIELYGTKTTHAETINCEKLLSEVYDPKFNFSEDIWEISKTNYPTLK